ncbi:hypothetical protein ACOSQ3_009950 [Xanthoceras sorbifolium]
METDEVFTFTAQLVEEMMVDEMVESSILSMSLKRARSKSMEEEISKPAAASCLLFSIWLTLSIGRD